jgi:TIR domain/Restriction endonuclease
MAKANIPEEKRRRIFLSYASEDKDVARTVADGLRSSGLEVWFEQWELASGDSISERIGEAVASSDVIVVLLSPDSLASNWVAHELNTALLREVGDRAISVIPVLVEDCEIPPLLANRVYLDLRHDRKTGIQRLVSQIAAASIVHFSELDARTFENLVGDLLTTLGFSVQRSGFNRDGGIDFVASARSRDPFGTERIDTWGVETRFYKEQRVSVDTLRQILGLLMTSPNIRRGLVVTNSGLTSVAREFLASSMSKSGYELRVIDGTELTNLLLQHPTLVRRYFGGAARHE